MRTSFYALNMPQQTVKETLGKRLLIQNAGNRSAKHPCIYGVSFHDLQGCLRAINAGSDAPR